jgi:predicted Holliday junction resolvase-like endonuclease
MFARKLSTKVDELVREYEKQKNDCVDKSAKKINVILVDRLADPLAPLVRDIHYQPMLYDILGAVGDSFKLKDKPVFLDETD